MNKSIYEEALDIVENIVRNISYTWVAGRDSLMKIKQALKQAQKQEKLLELYKEYFEYSEMLKDGRKFGGRMLVEHERDKIIEEIKELENEN